MNRQPTMYSHEAFLGNARRDPHDDTNWLVYSDWLEENGHTVPAQRIRWWIDARNAMNRGRDGTNSNANRGVVDENAHERVGRIRQPWVRQLFNVEHGRNTLDELGPMVGTKLIDPEDRSVVDDVHHMTERHALGLATDSDLGAMQGVAEDLSSRHAGGDVIPPWRAANHAWWAAAHTRNTGGQTSPWNASHHVNNLMGYGDGDSRFSHHADNAMHSSLDALFDHMQDNPPPNSPDPQDPEGQKSNYSADDMGYRQPVGYASEFSQGMNPPGYRKAVFAPNLGGGPGHSIFFLTPRQLRDGNAMWVMADGQPHTTRDIGEFNRFMRNEHPWWGSGASMGKYENDHEMRKSVMQPLTENEMEEWGRWNDPDYAAWEERVRSNPDDANMRAVYADWLQDRGHDEHAHHHRKAAGIIQQYKPPAPPPTQVPQDTMTDVGNNQQISESYSRYSDDPMMYGDDGDLLQQAIHANPMDADAHFAHSDWLRDQGDHDEADFREAMGKWVQAGNLNPLSDDHVFPWRTPIHSRPDGVWMEHVGTVQGQGGSPAEPPHIPRFFHGHLNWKTYPSMEAGFRQAYMGNLAMQRKEAEREAAWEQQPQNPSSMGMSHDDVGQYARIPSPPFMRPAPRRMFNLQGMAHHPAPSGGPGMSYADYADGSKMSGDIDPVTVGGYGQQHYPDSTELPGGGLGASGRRARGQFPNASRHAFVRDERDHDNDRFVRGQWRPWHMLDEAAAVIGHEGGSDAKGLASELQPTMPPPVTDQFGPYGPRTRAMYPRPAWLREQHGTGTIGAASDWLREHDRDDRADEINRTFFPKPPTQASRYIDNNFDYEEYPEQGWEITDPLGRNTPMWGNQTMGVNDYDQQPFGRDEWDALSYADDDYEDAYTGTDPLRPGSGSQESDPSQMGGYTHKDFHAGMRGTDDTTASMSYADWLHEQGLSHHAEMVQRNANEYGDNGSVGGSRHDTPGEGHSFVRVQPNDFDPFYNHTAMPGSYTVQLHMNSGIPREDPERLTDNTTFASHRVDPHTALRLLNGLTAEGAVAGDMGGNDQFFHGLLRRHVAELTPIESQEEPTQASRYDDDQDDYYVDAKDAGDFEINPDWQQNPDLNEIKRPYDTQDDDYSLGYADGSRMGSEPTDISGGYGQLPPEEVHTHQGYGGAGGMWGGLGGIGHAINQFNIDRDTAGLNGQFLGTGNLDAPDNQMLIDHHMPEDWAQQGAQNQSRMSTARFTPERLLSDAVYAAHQLGHHDVARSASPALRWSSSDHDPSGIRTNDQLTNRPDQMHPMVLADWLQDNSDDPEHHALAEQLRNHFHQGVRSPFKPWNGRTGPTNASRYADDCGMDYTSLRERLRRLQAPTMYDPDMAMYADGDLARSHFDDLPEIPKEVNYKPGMQPPVQVKSTNWRPGLEPPTPKRDRGTDPKKADGAVHELTGRLASHPEAGRLKQIADESPDGTPTPEFMDILHRMLSGRLSPDQMAPSRKQLIEQQTKRKIASTRGQFPQYARYDDSYGASGDYGSGGGERDHTPADGEGWVDHDYWGERTPYADELAPIDPGQLRRAVTMNPHDQELRLQLADALGQSGDHNDAIESAMHLAVVEPSPENKQYLAELLHQTGAPSSIAHAYSTQAGKWSDLIAQASAERYPGGKDAMHTMSRRQSSDMASYFAQRALEEGKPMRFNSDWIGVSQSGHERDMAERHREAGRYNQLAADRHAEAADEHADLGEHDQADIHQQAAESHRMAAIIRDSLAGEPKAIAAKPKPQLGMPDIRNIRQGLGEGDNYARYERGVPTMYVTPEEFQHVIGNLTPQEWRGHRVHPGVDRNNRLVAADMARDLGMDREADLLGDTGKYLYRDVTGIEDAGELAKQIRNGLRIENATDRFSRGYINAASDLSTDENDNQVSRIPDYHQHVTPGTWAAMIADATHFREQHGDDQMRSHGHGEGATFFVARNGWTLPRDWNRDWEEEDQHRLHDGAQAHGEYELRQHPDGMIRGTYEVPIDDDDQEPELGPDDIDHNQTNLSRYERATPYAFHPVWGEVTPERLVELNDMEQRNRRNAHKRQLVMLPSGGPDYNGDKGIYWAEALHEPGDRGFDITRRIVDDAADALRKHAWQGKEPWSWERKQDISELAQQPVNPESLRHYWALTRDRSYHPHIAADYLDDIGHSDIAQRLRDFVPSFKGGTPPIVERNPHGFDDEPTAPDDIDHNQTNLSRYVDDDQDDDQYSPEDRTRMGRQDQSQNQDRERLRRQAEHDQRELEAMRARRKPPGQYERGYPTYYAEPDEHPDHHAFIHAIHQKPEDVTGHMAHADWLDENGFPDEASFRRSMAKWVDGTLRRRMNGKLTASGERDSSFPYIAVPEHVPDGVDGNELTIRDYSPDMETNTDPTDAIYHNSILRWQTYPDMEAAFHRGFMTNLEKQREQQQPDADDIDHNNTPRQYERDNPMYYGRPIPITGIHPSLQFTRLGAHLRQAATGDDNAAHLAATVLTNSDHEGNPRLNTLDRLELTPLHMLRDEMLDNPQHPLSQAFNWEFLPEKVKLDDDLYHSVREHNLTAPHGQRLNVGDFRIGIPRWDAAIHHGNIEDKLLAEHPWATEQDIDHSARRNRMIGQRNVEIRSYGADPEQLHQELLAQNTPTKKDVERYERGYPTYYADHTTVANLLAQLEHPGHNHTRWNTPNHPNNDTGLRLAASDALRDMGRDQEADWLADQTRHVIVQEGRVAPGRFTDRHVRDAMRNADEVLDNHGMVDPMYEGEYSPWFRIDPHQRKKDTYITTEMVPGMGPRGVDQFHASRLPHEAASYFTNHAIRANDAINGDMDGFDGNFPPEVEDAVRFIHTAPYEEHDRDAGGDFEPPPERTPLIMDDGGLDADDYNQPPDWEQARYERGAPTMYNHAGFIHMINKKPKEVQHRLAFSDWLQENAPETVSPETLHFLQTHTGPAWAHQDPETGEVLAGKHWTMPEIKAASNAAGGHYFSAENKRYFNERAMPRNVFSGPGGVYFVSDNTASFDRSQNHLRRYPISMFHPKTGNLGMWGSLHKNADDVREYGMVNEAVHTDPDEARAFAKALAWGQTGHVKNSWYEPDKHGPDVKPYVEPPPAPPKPVASQDDMTGDTDTGRISEPYAGDRHPTQYAHNPSPFYHAHRNGDSTAMLALADSYDEMGDIRGQILRRALGQTQHPEGLVAREGDQFSARGHVEGRDGGIHDPAGSNHLMATAIAPGVGMDKPPTAVSLLMAHSVATEPGETPMYSENDVMKKRLPGLVKNHTTKHVGIFSPEEAHAMANGMDDESRGHFVDFLNHHFPQHNPDNIQRGGLGSTGQKMRGGEGRMNPIAPEPYSRGQQSTMYADQSTIRSLLKNARENPYDDDSHLSLADALEDVHPEHPVASLLRRQYGVGEHAANGPRENNWYEPHDNIGSFQTQTRQGTYLPGKAHIGTFGGFKYHLGHEGGPEQQQNWVVHAASTHPGSEDFAYSFEFPHEEAHVIPQMFPMAANHIARNPVNWSDADHQTQAEEFIRDRDENDRSAW